MRRIEYFLYFVVNRAKSASVIVTLLLSLLLFGLSALLSLEPANLLSRCHVTIIITFRLFAVRCFASAVYAVMRCLSVCLSRLYILSKQINISSNFFTVG